MRCFFCNVMKSLSTSKKIIRILIISVKKHSVLNCNFGHIFHLLQRILLATFVFVNGLNPVIFMEWAEARGMCHDRTFQLAVNVIIRRITCTPTLVQVPLLAGKFCVVIKISIQWSFKLESLFSVNYPCTILYTYSSYKISLL